MARSISKGGGKRARSVKAAKFTKTSPRFTDSMENFARDFVPRDSSPLEGMNQKQDDYIAAIYNSKLTFGIGPAGCGKTFIAASIACSMLMDGTVDKVILTRPSVEAGGGLGFMPGDLTEKYDHYLTPLLEVINKRLGRGAVEMFRKNGKIEVLPLEFMRGRTLDKCFVILDEAQNTTKPQMRMFLTRLGEDSYAVVDGDLSQNDLPPGVLSGLADAIPRIGDLQSVSVIGFTRADVVRSGLVQAIVERYED